MIPRSRRKEKSLPKGSLLLDFLQIALGGCDQQGRCGEGLGARVFVDRMGFLKESAAGAIVYIIVGVAAMTAETFVSRSVCGVRSWL